MALYLSLDCPTLDEMEGEFEGEWLAREAPLFSKLMWKLSACSNWSNGIWKGKSFQLLSEYHGWGFNNLKKFGGIVRRWPMRITIAPSRYDGKNSFSLRYGHYYSMCGLLDVQDEFRRLNDNCLLGLAHYRPVFGFALRPMWFLMKGPIGEFDASGHLLK